MERVFTTGSDTPCCCRIVDESLKPRPYDALPRQCVLGDRS